MCTVYQRSCIHLIDSYIPSMGIYVGEKPFKIMQYFRHSCYYALVPFNTTTQ